jgi:hypothetical protein
MGDGGGSTDGVGLGVGRGGTTGRELVAANSNPTITRRTKTLHI